jgi:hypothetical protein
MSNGLPPPVVGLGWFELDLLVALLVLEWPDIVDIVVDIDDDVGVVEDVDVLEDVDDAKDVVDWLEWVDEEFCLVIVLDVVWDGLIVVLDACELALCWLLLPGAPVPHPPPPPLAGGVQRKSVAAWSKNSPISVSGDAAVPWHASTIVFVIESSALAQAEEQEQSGPLLKWPSWHSGMGVS